MVQHKRVEEVPGEEVLRNEAAVETSANSRSDARVVMRNGAYMRTTAA